MTSECNTVSTCLDVSLLCECKERHLKIACSACATRNEELLQLYTAVYFIIYIQYCTLYMIHMQRKAKTEGNHSRRQCKEEHQWIKKKKTGWREKNDKRLTTHKQEVPSNTEMERLAVGLLHLQLYKEFTVLYNVSRTRPTSLEVYHQHRI